MRRPLTLAAALLVACEPLVDGVAFAGDVNSCSANLTCQSEAGGGVAYDISCTLNTANNSYDCICAADGVNGETFSEAGVCAQVDGAFADFDLADASAHALNDGKFPVAAAAEG